MARDDPAASMKRDDDISRADELEELGSKLLLSGEFSKSCSVLTRAAALRGKDALPLAWKRGLALWYAKRYEDSAAQFEVDMAANGSDVEEFVWRWLCHARISSPERATEQMLDLDNDDERGTPFMEILQMFRGQLKPSKVLRAPKDNKNGAAYANFYVGLFLSECGNVEEALVHLRAAAERPSDDFMGKLMKMHWENVTLPLLGSKRIPNVCIGCWQLSSGHSEPGQDHYDIMTQTYHAYIQRGITAFDFGDIYTGVEARVGAFIDDYVDSGGRREELQMHTKFVPDLDILASVDASFIKGVMARSCNRLRVAYLDLVQLHWWDYAVGNYVAAAQALACLPFVKNVGLTNFDAKHMKCILDAGVAIKSNQVQFSILDNRVKTNMLSLCKSRGIKLLCYGVLAGGFISDAWLDKPEPDIDRLENRSLVKYKLIIDEFGGWKSFQKLLATIKKIADARNATISMIAIAYVLWHPQVEAVILGVRNKKHLESTVKAATLIHLDDNEMDTILGVVSASKGPRGAFYELERDRNGKHGAIMRYNCGQWGLDAKPLLSRYDAFQKRWKFDRLLASHDMYCSQLELYRIEAESMMQRGNDVAFLRDRIQADIVKLEELTKRFESDSSIYLENAASLNTDQRAERMVRAFFALRGDASMHKYLQERMLPSKE